MNGKFCNVLIAAMALAASTYVFAAGRAQSDGIEGSVHDFSAMGWNNTGEICIVCHAPHAIDDTAPYTWENGLLWNHELSSETYVMYAEAEALFPDFISFIDGAYDTEPRGPSKLCLSCHDGTVALDAFSGRPDDDNPLISLEFRIPGFTVNGEQDLRGTHPISLTYDNTADLGLNDPNTATFTATGTLIADILWRGQVHCTSCHDVHDSPGETVVGTRLLRDTMDKSALCLACHNK